MPYCHEALIVCILLSTLLSLGPRHLLYFNNQFFKVYLLKVYESLSPLGFFCLQARIDLSKATYVFLLPFLLRGLKHSLHTVVDT